MMSVTVADVPELRRYEARIDGAVVGFAAYQRRGDVLVLTHTEVESEHEGQGVASTLAREVLDDVRRRGLRAMLRCPFLAEWASGHPEYDDLLAQPVDRSADP
jgi:predicted GNAT family acetyltransferase